LIIRLIELTKKALAGFLSLSNGLAQVKTNLRANSIPISYVRSFFCLALYAAAVFFLVKGVIVYCNRTATEP